MIYCRGCDMEFATKGDLDSHVERVHPMLKIENNEPAKLKDGDIIEVLDRQYMVIVNHSSLNHENKPTAQLKPWNPDRLKHV